ncbi:MAG: hypothetical protein KAI72_01530 [Candidatus Pacebacteria bacterium]|nr:hypothetical protein [Candidatus Paceibacterota bacterium]
MKKFISIFILGLISLNCFAVTAELKSVTKDESRNLYWVNIEYTTIDEEVFNNAYPVNSYKMMNKTTQEIQQWLVTNVKAQIDNYIAKEFFEDNNNLQPILESFVGQSIIKTEATVEYDTNNDGIVDKTYKIKEDGTYEEVIL